MGKPKRMTDADIAALEHIGQGQPEQPATVVDLSDTVPIKPGDKVDVLFSKD